MSLRTPSVQIEADVMRPGELMKRLGLKHARFGELQQMGKFRHLESPVGAATGARVYSRRKVAAWIDGPAFSLQQRKAS